MLYRSNSKVLSPCNGYCELEKKSKLCLGCFRTISEIVNWQGFTDEQKLRVLDLVKSRKLKAENNLRK